MCLIDNELTDCGGKWIANDTNSFQVVPDGEIDSVEVCIVVSVDVVKQNVLCGHSLTVVFSMNQTSPEREFNYSGIVICCYIPFI